MRLLVTDNKESSLPAPSGTHFYLVHSPEDLQDAINDFGAKNPILLTIDAIWGNLLWSPTRDLQEAYYQRKITPEEYKEAFRNHLALSFSTYTTEWLTLFNSQQSVALYCGCHQTPWSTCCPGLIVGTIFIEVMKKLQYPGQFTYQMYPCEHILHT